MKLYDSDIAPWQKVIVDDDPSLVGTATAFLFRPTSDGGTNRMVEVSYVHNGMSQTMWIERPRLTVKK